MGDPQQADCVIVGAGSAGCVLAARLSEDPARQVMLLEAGPDHRVAELPDELRFLSRRVDWPYEWGDEVRSTDDRRLTYARGRGVGGSSLTNGGVAMRAEPPDFEVFPQGWRWDDLLPHFRSLERDLEYGDEPWHGSDGPLPITRWAPAELNPMQVGFHEGCLALGFDDCADHNEPHTTGSGPIPMNRLGQRRISCNEAYLEPARGRANLTVRGDAHVRRILLDGTKAVGVELVDGSMIAADEIVLAAGVVQNPLVLWRSGIGPADQVRGLGASPTIDLPAVGANVTDHMVLNVSGEIDPTVIPDDAPSLQMILRTTAPDSDRVNDLQLTPYARRHADGRRELVMSVSLQLPDGAGTILPQSLDPDDRAVISWPFAAIDENRRRLVAGWRLGLDILEASGLAIDPGAIAEARRTEDADLLTTLAENHYAFYHGAGSCRMGGAGDAVVDDRCRVHGVDGLRIVDMSIVPHVPRSNTNLLAMAVADRAANLW